MQLEITKGSPQRNGCEIIFRNLANSKIIIIQETTNPQPRHTFEIHLDCGLIQEEDDSVYVSMITSGVEGCIAYICRGMWVEKWNIWHAQNSPLIALRSQVGYSWSTAAASAASPHPHNLMKMFAVSEHKKKEKRKFQRIYQGGIHWEGGGKSYHQCVVGPLSYHQRKNYQCKVSETNPSK